MAVKPRSGQIMRLAMPFRAASQRAALALLVVASVVLMVIGRSDIGIVEQVRVQFMDALAPALDALARPAATVAAMSRRVAEMATLREENARLREENAALLHARMEVRRLEAENTDLRSLLKVVPDAKASFISGRIIADSDGAFVNSVLLNAGARDGVKKGQAVMSGEGLAGRIIEVGERASRILLLTDLNSRIPVVVESTRDRAILKGDNSDQPVLAYLPAAAEVAPGDRVVTSVDGKAFPPGIPVGVVVKGADGVARVQPFVDFNRLEYVRVVDFGLSGSLPPLAPRPEE